MGDGQGNNSFWMGVVVLASYGIFVWLIPLIFHPAFLHGSHTLWAGIGAVTTLVGAIFNFTGGFDEDKGRIWAGVGSILINIGIGVVPFVILNGGF